MEKLRLIMALLIATGILLSACSPAQKDASAGGQPKQIQATEFSEEVFSVGDTARLELQNVSGVIGVKTGRPGQVTIGTTRIGLGKDGSEAGKRLASLSARVKRDGEVISLVADPGAAWDGKALDIAIVTQENASVKLTQGMGSIRVSGITGGVDIAGSTVTVNLSNIKGGVSMQVQSGAVFVDGAGGLFSMEARDAPVSIVRLSSPSLTVTGNTDVLIRDSQVEGEVSLKSSSGKLGLQRLRGQSIIAEAGKGSVEVWETTAEEGMTIKAVEGRVYANRVNSGMLKVVTSSGDIDISELQGGVDLVTKNGRISLSRATPSSLVIKSGDGDVALEGQFPGPGEASITTASGDISVTLPRETTLDLEAATKRGKVTIDPRFGLAGAGGSTTRMAGITGGGAVRLSLSSESGDIELDTGQN